MSTATLAGHVAIRASLHIPAWGVPWADVELGTAVTISGATTLVIADLTLACTVVSGGPSGGRSRYRIAGGAAGWGTELPALGYATDLGVKVSTVVEDAARLAGETLDASTVPTTRVGPHYVRAEGPAARVLEQLVPEAWYVGGDGVTRLGRRAAVALSVSAVRGTFDIARSTVTLAASSIATILPGVIVDGIEAVDVLHEVDAECGLRSTIWGTGSNGTSRRISAMRKLVESMLPDYLYRGLTEYRVVTQEGERLNLQPVRVSLGMPSLRRVKVRPGLPGCRADIALGSLVLVGFVNADAARPVVVSFEDAESPGFLPSILELAGGGSAVARVGDTAGRLIWDVAALTFYYSPSGVAAYVPVAVNVSTPVPPSPAAVGTPIIIATGSALVGAG